MEIFFSDEILNTILQHTNAHIQATAETFTRERDAAPTNIPEIQTLFGLLYMSAVLKSSRLHVKELLSTQGTGVELFRLVMSVNRFQFLLRHLRFDDAQTRNERKNLDKLAPIREIFETFFKNCKDASLPLCYN